MLRHFATGSSWTTAERWGLLHRVGQGWESLPMVAGAIISGAHFGDKMSPLSDTTNLVPLCPEELFEHIYRGMVTPSLLTYYFIYF